MRSEAVFSASMEHIVIRWVIGFDLEQFSRIFVENNSESNQPSVEPRSPGSPSPSPHAQPLTVFRGIKRSDRVR